MFQTEFIKKFNGLDGTIADVYIKHSLYGNQKIKRCILHPLVDGGRIGLVINGEDIYIAMNELKGVWVGNNEYIIKSEVMELYIIL